MSTGKIVKSDLQTMNGPELLKIDATVAEIATPPAFICGFVVIATMLSGT